MATFTHYRYEHKSTLARLEAEYQRLTPQQKSRRVLGRDNPLAYSLQAIADKMSETGMSSKAVERELDRQTSRFDSIAYHTLVQAPLRRIPLPEARWVFLDFTGQAGGWRYQRATAVDRFREAIAGKPPQETCRFLSGGIATSELLDRLLLEEFSQPGATMRVASQQVHCRFHLWVAQTRDAIPKGACIQIV
ncbi:MAG: hypothetical protein ACRERD_05935 [Candidatus Binatia bacterium]